MVETFVSTERMRSVHPAIQKVWIFSGIMGSLVLVAAAAGGDWALIRTAQVNKTGIPFLTILTLLLGPVRAIAFAKREYEAWKYLLTDKDLILSWGIWWKTVRYIPREAIQHLDINQGPLDRRFGLVQVAVHTAGTHAAVANIPGLTREQAEELRDNILAQSHA